MINLWKCVCCLITEIKESGEDYITRSFTPHKYHSGDQMKKNKMRRVEGTYGRQEMCIQGFDGETLGKETTWKN